MTSLSARFGSQRSRRRRVVALATVIVATCAVVVAGSAGAATPTEFSGGRVVPPVSDNHGGEFVDVSCLTSSSCVAVGDALQLDGTRTAVAQHWDGRTWSDMGTLPQLAAASAIKLEAVSCVSANDCLAIGNYADAVGHRYALAEIWNGRRWRLTSADGPGYRSFGSLACVASDACLAVGHGPRGNTAWRWDGRGWHLLQTPHPGLGSSLADISCAAPGNCTAVGNYVSDRRRLPLIETWGGRAWRQQTSPLPAGARGDLRGVSCPTPASCTAVGVAYFDGRPAPLVENRQADSAYRYGLPRDGRLPAATLTAISCAGPYRCTAGGTYEGRSTSSPFVASRTSDAGFGFAPVTKPSSQGQFFAVSCPGGPCELVGAFVESKGRFLVAAQGVGTSTSQQPTVTPGTTVAQAYTVGALHGGGLHSVSCPDATFCIGLTDYGYGSTGVEMRGADGTWAVTPAPPPAPTADLAQVSCASRTFCMAVADDGDDITDSEIWNGTAWTTHRIAPAGTFDTVSCSSPTFCLAMGDTESNGTVAAVWNGSRWSSVDTSSLGQFFAGSVSCPADGSCVAVGQRGDSAGIASYATSSGLTLMTPPTRPSAQRSLDGVSCTSATACVAVGGTQAGAVETDVLAGGTWSAVPAATGTGGDSFLEAVSCSAADSCVAVGYQPALSSQPAGSPVLVGPLRPLVQAWDGSRWTLVADAPPTGASSALFSISCPSSCVAVGTSASVSGVPFVETGAS